LAWRSHLQFEDLKTEAWLPSVTAQITGLSEVAGQWSSQHKALQLAQTQLQGTFKGLPLHIDSPQFNIDLSQFLLAHIPTFSTQQTQIIWGNNQLQLDGGLTQNTWNLIADTQLNDLSQLLPQLQGQLNGMVAVRGQNQKPSFTVMDLWAQDLAIDKKVSVDTATLYGTLQALGEEQSQLQLSAHQVQLANRVIPDMGISLNGTQKQHQLTWQVLAEPVVAEGVLQGALDDKRLIGKAKAKVAWLKCRIFYGTTTTFCVTYGKCSKNKCLWRHIVGKQSRRNCVIKRCYWPAPRKLMPILL
jgi:autotransporter translocation and assembly factor TamB